jgi:tRNA (mo5U34)-methyltransferase
MASAESELAEVVAAAEWYHTLELAPGIVTPGWFDTRAVAARLPIPADLRGKRCLDIGTFDGFWAFELERRGAAEVVAVDVLDPHLWDWPANSTNATLDALARRKRQGSGFQLASQQLGSRVRLLERSVYDLSPEDVGSFDFIYLGSLLIHLRDPVGALRAALSVCAGQLLSAESVDLPLSLLLPRTPTAYLDGRGRPWWWRPNRAALVRMFEAAGFRLVGSPQFLLMPAGKGQPRPALRLSTLVRSRQARELATSALLGDPHLASLMEPV